jgi:hypothetical protein
MITMVCIALIIAYANMKVKIFEDEMCSIAFFKQPLVDKHGKN